MNSNIIITYTLFYYGRDKESTNIYDVISRENLGRMFNYIDVDTYSPEQLCTLKIARVPTIVISSNKQGSRPEIYDGPSECAKFLNNMIMNRRSMQINEAQNRMKSIQQAQISERMKYEGPSEFSEMEMSGCSDDYAYLNTNIGQSKSFVKIVNGQEMVDDIITLNLGKEKKINENQSRKQIDDLMKQREHDIDNIKNNMEQKQIDAIIGC